MYRNLPLLLVCFFGLINGAHSQGFTFATNLVEISVAPGFNHMPVRVGITTNAPGMNVSQMVVQSDANWVSPSVDAATSKIVLSFTTSNLINQQYTATITAAIGGQTNSFSVRAYIAALNIFRLKDDPLRSRTYGIHQNGLGLGSIVVLDPVTTNAIGNVTVGHKPSDLAISADGRELFVINCVDESISVIDLTTLTLKEILALPAFDNWGTDSTTANIALGPSNIIYYTDGSWAPVLRVLNRSTLQVLQSFSDGFGDIGLASDKSILFAWMQYGWSAGLASSYVLRFSVASDGLLTLTDQGSSQYSSAFARDPLETPVLVSSDNQTFFIKGFALGADSASSIKYSFPSSVYSITPGGEIAVTDSSIYKTDSGIKLADLPRVAPVQTISSDYSRFIYYDSAARALKVLNLFDLIGPGILNRDIVPADGSITLSPPRLQWSPLPGVDRYQVYLGVSESAVSTAGTNSPAFLGTVTQPYFVLGSALTPGTKYFWRVDALTQYDTTKGDVNEFTVSIVSSSVNQINVATVQGHSSYKTSFQLNSNPSGVPWQATADRAWVTFTQSTGTTPATVEVVLNASQLSNGLQQATVTISSGGSNLFSIPITLRVDPLSLTILKSDPDTVFVYGISEDLNSTPRRAYLVEINSLTESIRRVVPVGSSATDLALHKPDNRIYVPNWLTGSLLAIDLSTFQQVRSYPFAPFGGVGYSQGDIYRVSAGGPGRLIWEEEDQWIDIAIFNTIAGTNMARAFVREGGGGFSPDHRYYYHGDNNSSGAEIHKFDIIGDQFAELAHVRVEAASYYGSRTVIVSEQGNRIFWAGGIFDPDLRVEWTIGEIIHAASGNGRYAFAESKVYDVEQRTVITNLTPATPIKAYNSITDKLVYNKGGAPGYFKLESPRVTSPADAAIVFAPGELRWDAVPTTTAYEIYLGQSKSQVSVATTNSPVYLGQSSVPSIALSNTLSAGTYYWRADAVTPYGTVPGRVYSFTVSPIVPSQQEISDATFMNRSVTISVTLTSAVAGQAWQAIPDSNWISLNQSNGATPSTLQVTLNASVSTPTVRTGSITISGNAGTLFSIPVKLSIESLNLTVIKSDPASARVYAISEAATAPAHAYLLEINTVTETIERVVDVGSSVTDLAIHNADNRIYVPNWLTGALLAVDKSTFQVVRSYTFALFGGTGYSQGDIYRVSAGGPGRLIWEEEDQWIDIAIFDTVAGTNMARTFVREGGGGFSADHRYYYHGDNNSSGAEIHKYDVIGDRFTELAHVRVDAASYYGSRTVVVSEQGNRIFWAGGVFDPDLRVEWTVNEIIHAASANGRYAFAESKVYDVEQRTVVTNLPSATPVKAYNSITDKLVYNKGGGIGYFKLESPRTTTPADGAIVFAPSELRWDAVPTTTSYQIYLGQSKSLVSVANTNSPLYLGQSTTAIFALSATLSPGTYYWRVDAVTPYGTVPGQVYSFTVSPIIASQQEINAATFMNRPVTISITLTSAVAGQTWQAVPDSSWISLTQSNGATPSTLQVTLSASVSAPIVRTGSITVSGSAGALFSIPVKLSIESLNLTIIKSDPASARVFAISEATTAPARAYLLEINTTTETIERVVDVGSSVTDLAIHNGDNRIYVPNWLTGALLAVDKGTFQVVRTYPFAPFGGVGYSQGDIYRVSAGAPGRIIWEEEDQWIDMAIFDTVAGTNMGHAFVREGGGGFGGNGRYYYHGDNNSSGAEIHKYDVLGDRFTELAHVRVSSVSYYGSRTVVVSEDGSRVFWNGSVFNADLAQEWSIGAEIFATSANGRYAFSQNNIYDIPQKQVILGMPASTRVSAYNSTSQKLVVQNGNTVGFYLITDPLTLAAPTLSSISSTYNSTLLSWIDRSLEDSFTIQKRVSGSSNWLDVTTVARNTTQYLVGNLLPETTYEFRIKADAGTVSSAWSDIISVTTLAVPPTTPYFNNPVASIGWVALSWSNPSYETQLILERSVGSTESWSPLATLPADTVSYTDSNVVSRTTYYYRIRARNGAGDSGYSIVGVTVPAPQPPTAPSLFFVRSLSNATVLATWNDVLSETGYTLQRRTETPGSWSVVATLPADMVSFIDTNVTPFVQYWYRVQAFNTNGPSAYSQELSAIPLFTVNLIADDFDPDVDPVMWTDIAGGVATNGGQGFGSSKVLYFAGPGARSATTIAADVSAGGTLEFLLRAGNELADGSHFWNNSEPGESIVVEYSNDGQSWGTLASINTVFPAFSNWVRQTISLPSWALSANTQFRWRQLANSGPGFDTWAIEDVIVSGPAPLPPQPVPFIISSPNSSTSIAIFWADADGASSYIIERRRSLQLWVEMARLPSFTTYFTDNSLLPDTAYTYRVKAVNPGGSSGYSPLTTSLTWSQLEQWCFENYERPDALDMQAMTNRWTDGSLPLLRYAFNLTAIEPQHIVGSNETSGYPAIWLDRNRNRLSIEFIRRKASMKPGIDYQVLFSPDLVTWTTSSNLVNASSIDAIWERVRYEDSVTAGATRARFGRVGVSLR